METNKFEAGQTWLWEGRAEPDENWTLWHVIEACGDDWMLIMTLASGAQGERTDEVGFVYHIPSMCIMATDSRRVA